MSHSRYRFHRDAGAAEAVAGRAPRRTADRAPVGRPVPDRPVPGRILRQLGVAIVTERDARVHVSGHPAAEDLRRLYEWVAPARVIPVHGTPRHLQANIEIAQSRGVEQTFTVPDGTLFQIAPGEPEVLQEVEVGRLTPGRDGTLEAVPAAILADMREKAR